MSTEKISKNITDTDTHTDRGHTKDYEQSLLAMPAFISIP